MSKVPERVHTLAADIAHSQDVKLLHTSSTSSIDGKQDRPRNGAANQERDDGHLKEAQEQVAIEGVMLKNIVVGSLEESAEPAEQSIWELWRALSGVTRQSIMLVARGLARGWWRHTAREAARAPLWLHIFEEIPDVG